MSISATAKSQKHSIGATLAFLAVVTILMYIPVWHHHTLGIVVVFALAGNRLVQKTKSHGFRRAFMGFLGTVLLTIGVWEHMWLLIIVAAIMYAGLIFKDFLEK